MHKPDDITAMLALLNEKGEADAVVEQLLPKLYDDLRARAGRAMAREVRHHTLQPTALVHEAYLRLARSEGPKWESRSHFLAIASRVMRQVLVDHARRRNAERRGGPDKALVTLNEERLPGLDAGQDLMALHQALERLEGVDERTARVAELRLFGGATVPEIAEALDISSRTVDNEWAAARMWLARALSDE